MEKLKNEGMDSLILDLRNNPGGLLSSAINVAERFVPEGGVIVSIKGRGTDSEAEEIVRGQAPLYDLPVVVLVNEYSASGSEIVAAALQDHGRAVLLGSNTYGKGSVQTMLNVSDGSGIKITTSRYYSPKGSVIDKVGVSPDIIADVSDETRDIETGEPKDDPQVKQAIDLLKSHKILKHIRI